MRIHAGLGDLVEQIKEASRNIELSNARKDKRLDSIEASVNELFRKTRRPGGFMVADDDAGVSAQECDRGVRYQACTHGAEGRWHTD